MKNRMSLVTTLAVLCVFLVPFHVHATPENDPTVSSGKVDHHDVAGVNYPRVEQFVLGSVRVDFPGIESWSDFRYLRAWLPVEITLAGEEGSQIGSVLVQGLTAIDFETRTVGITELEMLDTNFSPVQLTESARDLMNDVLSSRERTVALDVLLRLLPEDFSFPDQSRDTAQLNFEPPVIVISDTPLQLLSIDKEPIKAMWGNYSLEYVVNTNWNIFFSSEQGRWYVLNNGTWQSNNSLSDGGWVVTENLPPEFQSIPVNDRWQLVHDALPARLPEKDPVPFIISLQATELILTDGPVRLGPLGDTGIEYVTNTRSDLFHFDERWYVLISGRWFTNTDLLGQWQYVSHLPQVFANIEPVHEKGHVLYAIPGTRQARISLIEAALPHRTSVIEVPVAELDVTWRGEPRFTPIDLTGLERGSNTSYQVIKHNNFYYLCHEGAWYFSATADGPWQPTREIPDEIFRIPATDPAYNVTFVKPDADQEQVHGQINFSYTGGYLGNFSTGVSVVYGTGWHSPYLYYRGSASSSFYWHHVPTYGYGALYDPIGGVYGWRPGYYNPWGYSTTVSLVSPAREFVHAQGGPFQTSPGRKSDNEPISPELYQPDRVSDGTEKPVEITQSDGYQATSNLAHSLYLSSTLSSNMFSGRNGEVYKHENDEWEQYDEGNWSTMQEMQKQHRIEEPLRRPSPPASQGWLPAHKRTLSIAELDRQQLARLEGMDNYSRHRMRKESQAQADNP